MVSVDPFPAVSTQDAKRLLQKFFGSGSVDWEQPFGPVFIQFPDYDGTVRVRRFTWQQAKYLAACPAKRDDIISGHHPIDWPE